MKYYSYVMGVNNDILKLQDLGFIVNKDEENFTIEFDENNLNIWENFINTNLKNGYWNEVIGPNITFFFKLENGEMKKYLLNKDTEKEILLLCSKLANFKFTSIDEMLQENEFYNKVYFSKK